MNTIQSLISRVDNYTATVMPTATDDITKGYTIGSQWYDTVGKNSYSCVDATASAAVWKQNGYNVTISLINNVNHTVLASENGTTFVVLTNTAASIMTLPLVSGVSSGFTVVITKNTTGNSVTVQTSGADAIKYQDATTTNIVLSRMGDTLTLTMANGAWAVTNEITPVTHPVASEVAPGIAEIATQAEVNAALDATRYVTPATLAGSYGNIPHLGNGQLWTNMIGSRSPGVTYTNTTGRPIAIYVTTYAVNATTSYLYINGANVSIIGASIGGGFNTNLYAPLTAIIPAGSTYMVTVSGSSVVRWWELR